MSRLDEIKARAANRRYPQTAIPPVRAPNKYQPFDVLRWFDRVRLDESLLNDALDYYKKAIDDARQHITAQGHLETLVAETPGLEYLYKGILVDVQMVRKWYDELYEQEIGRRHRWYMTSTEARDQFGDVKTNEATKWVKADDRVAEMAMIIRRLAHAEHHLLSVIEGFTARSIMLNHLVAIRKHNLTEVWINPTRETTNE